METVAIISIISVLLWFILLYRDPHSIDGHQDDDSIS